ncbi:MAG: hypothetical protein V2A77_02165 [Pseudomonadota bacterium]
MPVSDWESLLYGQQGGSSLATFLERGLNSLGLPIRVQGASRQRGPDASDLKALSELRDAATQRGVTSLAERGLPMESPEGLRLARQHYQERGIEPPEIDLPGKDPNILSPSEAVFRPDLQRRTVVDPSILYGYAGAPMKNLGERGKLGAETEAADELAGLRRSQQGTEGERARLYGNQADFWAPGGPRARSEKELGGQRGSAARLNTVRAGLLPGESASLVNQRNAAAELNRVNAGLAPARAVPGSLPLTPGSQNAYKELVRDYPPDQVKVDEVDYRAVSKHARGLGFEPIWTRDRGTYYLQGYEAKGGTAATSALPPRAPAGGGETKTINGRTYTKVNGQWFEQ